MSAVLLGSRQDKILARAAAHSQVKNCEDFQIPYHFFLGKYNSIPIKSKMPDKEAKNKNHFVLLGLN